MVGPGLAFISRQLANLANDVRGMRGEVERMAMGQRLVREELRMLATTVNRLGDMVRYDVLDRLGKLEHDRAR